MLLGKVARVSVRKLCRSPPRFPPRGLRIPAKMASSSSSSSTPAPAEAPAAAAAAAASSSSAAAEAAAASASASAAAAPVEATPAGNAGSGGDEESRPATAPELAAEARQATGFVDGDPGPAFRTKSKRRFAVLLGYSGIGYHGLQINKGFLTIESVLEKALYDAGALKAENTGDLRKTGWNRAARTDKGVHAFGQCVSMRLHVSDDAALAEQFRLRLNECLPENIEAFAVLRVNKSFNSKNACSGRKYEYLIPTFLLQPPPAKLATSATSATSATPDTPATPGTPDKSEASAESAESAEKAEGADESGKPEKSGRQAKELSTAQCEALRRSEGFTFDAAVQARLDAAFKVFEGTHAFHNFTGKLGGDDPSAKRHIVSVKTDPPVEHAGIQFVRVNIEGQSFMLHQIRKMVTAAVEVTRRGLDPKSVIVDLLLDPGSGYHVGMAPGEGLALRACLYKYHNEKFAAAAAGAKEGGNTQSYEPLQMESGPVGARVETFRDTVVYPTIAAQEAEGDAFAQWLHYMNKRPFPPRQSAVTVRFSDYKQKQQEENEAFKKKRMGGLYRPPKRSLEELHLEVGAFAADKRQQVDTDRSFT